MRNALAYTAYISLPLSRSLSLFIYMRKVEVNDAERTSKNNKRSKLLSDDRIGFGIQYDD